MGTVLTFNQLLHAGGLVPETVRLLRHRDSKPRIHRALYDAAMKGDPKFAPYQERQGTPQVIERRRAGHGGSGSRRRIWCVLVEVNRPSCDCLEDQKILDACHRGDSLAKAGHGSGSECFVLEGRPPE